MASNDHLEITKVSFTVCFPISKAKWLTRVSTSAAKSQNMQIISDGKLETQFPLKAKICIKYFPFENSASRLIWSEVRLKKVYDANLPLDKILHWMCEAKNTFITYSGAGAFVRVVSLHNFLALLPHEQQRHRNKLNSFHVMDPPQVFPNNIFSDMIHPTYQ